MPAALQRVNMEVKIQSTDGRGASWVSSQPVTAQMPAAPEENATCCSSGNASSFVVMFFHPTSVCQLSGVSSKTVNVWPTSIEGHPGA